MGRTRNKPPVGAEDNFDPEKLEAADQAARQLGRQQEQAVDAAQAVALRMGYDGTLTVGALEDEIRFYQRRTVEAILETGKRLLVLKELTPRGEFDQRVELLGFSRRTAYRFMQAATKTAKSANLAQISAQIKNTSAFLELVTHDDDVLEEFSKLDDIDKMCASQVRARLRDELEDSAAKDAVLADTKARLTELEIKVGKRKKTLPPPEPDQIAAEFVATAHEAEATACAWIEGYLRQAIDDLLTHDEQNGSDHRPVLSGFIARIEDATDALRIKYAIRRVTPDDPFGPLSPEEEQAIAAYMPTREDAQ
ncbi:hypothetical protein [Paraburkholderia fungorum]|uniref:hypothetical protein n=1 Tax=Paraburkholderia fungorum TaxID=134537 RepID=UPI00402BDBC2